MTTINVPRRTLAGAALIGLSGLASLASPSLHAQPTWPTMPIRWIVPFPPGGPLDAIARKLAEAVAAQTGQSIVIENRTGASGTLGAAEVARAKPDGYTFVLTSSDTFINAMALIKRPPFDSRKDFMYLTQVAESGAVLMLSGDAPEASLAAVVAQARARPGTVSYGSWGPGSYTHLLMDEIGRRSNADFLHVPYRGAMPAIQDLLAKQVQLAFAPANVAGQLAQKGAVKLLAVSGDRRSPLLPAVPTFSESGFDAPILRTRVWLGLAAPVDLSPAIASAMVAHVQTALQQPAVAKFIADTGFAVIGNTPAEFRRSFDREYAITLKVIKDAGVVAE
jgi:tripartite-type tricarboxylate transporter receptor subunit TctC